MFYIIAHKILNKIMTENATKRPPEMDPENHEHRAKKSIYLGDWMGSGWGLDVDWLGVAKFSFFASILGQSWVIKVFFKCFQLGVHGFLVFRS